MRILTDVLFRCHASNWPAYHECQRLIIQCFLVIVDVLVAHGQSQVPTFNYKVIAAVNSCHFQIKQYVYQQRWRGSDKNRLNRSQSCMYVYAQYGTLTFELQKGRDTSSLWWWFVVFISKILLWFKNKKLWFGHLFVLWSCPLTNGPKSSAHHIFLIWRCYK